jgi:phosphoribosylformylglycinamidine synthase subunit PurL
LAVALAEMAVAGGCGLVTEGGESMTWGELFTELPSRVVVATSGPAEVIERAARAGVPATVLGRCGGDRLGLWSLADLSLEQVKNAWSETLPVALGESA